jgi:hypothetical protein
MSIHELTIEQVDRDGALREAAAAVEGDTRLDFLRKAGIGMGALMGGGAVLAALAPEALAGTGRPPRSFGAGNIGILNYALTLEYLESTFYDQAVASGAIKDPGLHALAMKIKADEAAHVAFLRKALGHKAAKKPSFDFGETVTNQTKFAETSFALENTGVSAYFGQALNIKGDAYVKDAVSIMTVEARHSGAIGYYLAVQEGASVANKVSPEGAFDKPRTAAAVLKIVKGTGFIKG